MVLKKKDLGVALVYLRRVVWQWVCFREALEVEGAPTSASDVPLNLGLSHLYVAVTPWASCLTSEGIPEEPAMCQVFFKRIGSFIPHSKPAGQMYYLHFTDEEIKTQRSSMTCLRSQNQQVAVGSDVGLFGSET